MDGFRDRLHRFAKAHDEHRIMRAAKDGRVDTNEKENTGNSPRLAATSAAQANLESMGFEKEL